MLPDICSSFNRRRLTSISPETLPNELPFKTDFSRDRLLKGVLQECRIIGLHCLPGTLAELQTGRGACPHSEEPRPACRYGGQSSSPSSSAASSAFLSSLALWTWPRSSSSWLRLLW
jgi:hypothetical protein